MCIAALIGLVAATGTANGEPIDPARLSQHTKILSSDEFEGRGPGTPGEAKSIAYISQQFQPAGAGAGGENGSWLQTVKIIASRSRAPP
jgi:aminopeptidase